MAAPKGSPVNVEPRSPTQAQPAGNEVSQDKAQQIAEAISQSLAGVSKEMQRVLEALTQMGVPEEQLAPVMESVQGFVTSVQDILGGGSDQGNAEAANQTVDSMGGAKGVPA